MTPWTGDHLVARPLPTHRTTQTQNKRTQISMSRAEFEPTMPVFERGKTVHALDRAATAISCFRIYAKESKFGVLKNAEHRMSGVRCRISVSRYQFITELIVSLKQLSFIVCILLCVVTTWLGNVSVNTTMKMVSQLKAISHRLNCIVYRNMFQSSWDHHQAVYIINAIKLIEISWWIHCD
jgi:hypothetical protein